MAPRVGVRAGDTEPRPVKSHLLMHDVRNHRIKRGISLERLAKMTGFHIRTLIRWEQGEISPTLDNLCTLCEHLELLVNIFDMWDPRLDDD